MTKNLKPFDLEAAKRGDPVCTRDGREARVVCFDAMNGIYPLVVLVKEKNLGNEYYEDLETYTIDGAFHSDSNNGSMDLMMLPKTRKLWIAVEKKSHGKGWHAVGDSAVPSKDNLGYLQDSDKYQIVEIEIEI